MVTRSIVVRSIVLRGVLRSILSLSKFPMYFIFMISSRKIYREGVIEGEFDPYIYIFSMVSILVSPRRPPHPFDFGI